MMLRERFHYALLSSSPWNRWWTGEKQAFWENRGHYWTRETVSRSTHLEQAGEAYRALPDEKLPWGYGGYLRKAYDYGVFEMIYQGVLALSQEALARCDESSYGRSAWERIVQTLRRFRPRPGPGYTLFNEALGRNLSVWMKEDWEHIFGIRPPSFREPEHWKAALVRCTIFEQYTFEFGDDGMLLYGMAEFPRDFYFGSFARDRAKKLPWECDAVWHY